MDIKSLYNKLKNLDLPWVIDPKDKAPSVSLTLLVISFIAVLISWGLVLSGKVTEVGPVLELLYASMANYFGRRLSISTSKGKVDASAESQDK